MRVGMGYDVHRLTNGRPLILGGVDIPFDRGLLGHSDADVLVHAICDALLGAAGLGDIGLHFPDTDPAYKDADSLSLLKRVGGMLSEKGFSIANIDATILAESPKISPYRDEMISNIAGVLDIVCHMINIKATTTEGLGSIGRKEGIAAMAVAMIGTGNDQGSAQIQFS
jgi:2-C-methyl-D-erythritol 2,4-cyclodiphosphate synthase